LKLETGDWKLETGAMGEGNPDGMKPVFECRMCGECCYGKGGIRVDAARIRKIAAYLQTTPNEFQARYCESRNGRVYLAVGADRFCVFFEKGKGCGIHPVKPEVCRLWPFFSAIVADPDNLELAKAACPGIRADCTHEEFVQAARVHKKADNES
jgi:hypothetical protein